jgi:hypothetical protein
MGQRQYRPAKRRSEGGIARIFRVTALRNDKTGTDEVVRRLKAVAPRLNRLA